MIPKIINEITATYNIPVHSVLQLQVLLDIISVIHTPFPEQTVVAQSSDVILQFLPQKSRSHLQV